MNLEKQCTSPVKMKIYLASKSPRRAHLLNQIGIEFETLSVEIDETWDGREHAAHYVCRLAMEKAQTGISGIQEKQDAIVIGADTAVVLDHIILGKANNPDEALSILKSLSGRTHQVYTAVAVVSHKRSGSLVNVSQVSFKPLTGDEIKKYAESGEPLGKAGGYAIQGKAAAFISRLDGSYSGVMGLPVFELSELLQDFRQNP